MQKDIDVYYTLYRADGLSYLEVQVKDQGQGIQKED